MPLSMFLQTMVLIFFLLLSDNDNAVNKFICLILFLPRQGEKKVPP